jgi:hypothetical protein
MTQSHVSFATDPPSKEDNTTSLSSTPVSKSQTLSELTVASIFIEGYRHCIMRADDAEYDSYTFYAPHLVNDDDGNRLTIPVEGGVLPDAFVFSRVCELIAELVTDADEFTKGRCGAFEFAAGVMGFLRSNQRLVLPRMRPLDHGYDFTRMNRVVETRREHRQRAAA